MTTTHTDPELLKLVKDNANHEQLASITDEVKKSIVLDNANKKDHNSWQHQNIQCVYKITKWSLIAVGIILFFQGFLFIKFHLSDKVLITLITGAIANILGLYAIVLRYLFSKK